MTNHSGTPVRRYDYFPFGQEIASGYGSRTTVTGYTTDTLNPKFTGKPRDYESGLGLDYFGARYLSSAQGRFTSPDPMQNSAKPWDPQSWNRYSYALNNPLKFVDPNGLYNLVNTCAEDDKKCNKQFEQNAAKLKQGITDLQARVDKMKAGAEKDRLQAALGAMGTENDKNNVNVQFGPTGDGAAAQTNPFYNEQMGKVGFNVIFDPKHITGGTNDWAIDAAHEGTHVADISDPRYNNPATTLSPFSIEYRGYTTSAWAASALGLPSLSYGRYQIWNPSWGLVDKTLTNYITSMKDKQGRQNHPETVPHNPWGN
jgi:RHS repeat-associated protein